MLERLDVSKCLDDTIPRIQFQHNANRSQEHLGRNSMCYYVSGIPNLANLRQNLDIAKRFTSLTESDRSAIADKVTEIADAVGLEPYRGWLY